MVHTTSSVREWGCKRRYFWKYVECFRPALKGKALLLGSMVHRGLEAYKAGNSIQEALDLIGAWRVDSDSPEFWDTEDGQIEHARARAMLRAYYAQWTAGRDQWVFQASEEPFAINIGGHEYAGVIDALAGHANSPQGPLYLWDHKTTSDEISNAGVDYFQHLALDVQIAAYCEAVKVKYGAYPAILWDVLRKPTGKPKTKEVIRRRKDESDESVAARKAACMETLQEFEDRLVAEMAEEPDAYYVRRQVFRTAEQQAEAIKELCEVCAEIEVYASKPGNLYPKNDALCTNRYGSCPFLGVCAGVESIDSDKFVREETAHPELKKGQPSAMVAVDDCPL
jgi:hypothetical protein